MRRTLVVVLGSVVTVIVIAAAGVAALIYTQGHAKRPAAAEMVALGSSYAAGPGLGARAPGSLFLCAQSLHNYPHLVAADRSMTLADATCSGATAANVVTGGQYWQPAQITAVHADAKVVTITVGGNDVFYIGNLAAWACANHPEALSWSELVLCGKAHSERDVDGALAQLQGRLSTLFELVRQRAPHARIIAVNYLTMLPRTGTCHRLGVDEVQAAEARRIATALSSITAAAALLHGVELVNVAEASRDHDACAKEPWVEGFLSAHGDGAPFHPNRAGTANVARLVLATLASSSPR